MKNSDPNEDQLGQRIRQINYCCNPNHSISYTYDDVGNILTADVGDDYGWTFGYDNIYQVTDADQIAQYRWIDLSYDRVYNRTYWGDSGQMQSYNYQSNAVNQYTQIDSTVPTYDANGNMTTGYGGGPTLVYDCENRLVSAGVISYTYDLLGRRASRHFVRNNPPINSMTVYVWDGAHIIAEYENGSLTKKYIYGPGIDNPVAMINVSGTSESWYYYYKDVLGSIRLITNASGAIVESYTYDPYGRPRVMTSAYIDGNWLTEDADTSQTSAIGNRLMFTARDWDSYTGLYYYRFRDYSPILGRFLQPDPAKYIDGMNLYAYCGNNPINFRDPYGLFWKEI